MYFILVLPKLNYSNRYYFILKEVKEDIYSIFLDLLVYIFKIKTFHAASAWKNARPIIEYCKSKNLTSIYEVRGMWHITGGSRHLHYKKNLKKYKELKPYCQGEKFCIQKLQKPLFITTQLQEYATKYN